MIKYHCSGEEWMWEERKTKVCIGYRCDINPKNKNIVNILGC